VNWGVGDFAVVQKCHEHPIKVAEEDEMFIKT
jgi:hypothetical protein